MTAAASRPGLTGSPPSSGGDAAEARQVDRDDRPLAPPAVATTGSHIVWSLPSVCSSTSTGPVPRRLDAITRVTRRRPQPPRRRSASPTRPPPRSRRPPRTAGSRCCPATLARTSDRSPAICATSHGRTGAPLSEASSPPVASPSSRTARPRSGDLRRGLHRGRAQPGLREARRGRDEPHGVGDARAAYEGGGGSCSGRHPRALPGRLAVQRGPGALHAPRAPCRATRAWPARSARRRCVAAVNPASHQHRYSRQRRRKRSS